MGHTGDVSRVQHENIVGYIAHNAEIVGDKYIGVPGLALVLFQQVKHLRLHDTSSADTASSATTRSGFAAKALASATLCC